MNRLQHLAENAGRLRTRIGGAFVGQRVVFRGHNLHRDLKNLDCLELYLLGITDRRFTKEQLKLLHALWVVTSYPDARIWNNRVAALAGSARSTGALGIAAALAVSEAKIYGFNPGIRAYDFLAAAQQRCAAGDSLEAMVEQEIKTKRGIGGYGRPLAAEDERIGPIMEIARGHGHGDGPHVRLAFETEAIILRRRLRLKMNYAVLTAALLLDMGFTRQQYYLFVFPIFLASMPPCFMEAAERAEGSLFPIACADISYEGVPKRPWPADT
jgi:hypothetical protein